MRIRNGLFSFLTASHLVLLRFILHCSEVEAAAGVKKIGIDFSLQFVLSDILNRSNKADVNVVLY